MPLCSLIKPVWLGLQFGGRNSRVSWKGRGQEMPSFFLFDLPFLLLFVAETNTLTHGCGACYGLNIGYGAHTFDLTTSWVVFNLVRWFGVHSGCSSHFCRRLYVSLLLSHTELCPLHYRSFLLLWCRRAEHCGWGHALGPPGWHQEWQSRAVVTESPLGPHVKLFNVWISPKFAPVALWVMSHNCDGKPEGRDWGKILMALKCLCGVLTISDQIYRPKSSREEIQRQTLSIRRHRESRIDWAHTLHAKDVGSCPYI